MILQSQPAPQADYKHDLSKSYEFILTVDGRTQFTNTDLLLISHWVIKLSASGDGILVLSFKNFLTKSTHTYYIDLGRYYPS